MTGGCKQLRSIYHEEVMSTDTEEIEGEIITTTVTPSALAELNRSEIDCQITTARAYPRSIKAFKRKAMELATLDEETAASMFYVLPRAGKKIEGPSIRLAEVVGSAFGNLRYSARIVKEEREFITAQGTCHDLESNNAASVEVRRRITNKSGARFNADMIQTTGNAACSIALREAIFKIVPRAIFKDVYEQSRLCSVGKANSFNESRHKAFDWFKKAGATESMLLAFLGRPGIDDVTIDDLITLRGLVTSIKEGEITIEDALRPEGTADSKSSKTATSDLTDKLSIKKTAAKEPATEPTNANEGGMTAAESIEYARSELATCKTVEEIMARAEALCTGEPDEMRERIMGLAEMQRAVVKTKK